MTVARLVASSYDVSSSSYLTVSNPSNMYTNTDSTNYADVAHTATGTTSYQLYIRGFNFGSIPANAVVSSFRVLIKGYETRNATSTSYAPRLVNNTTALSGTTASENFSTSTHTIEIPTGSYTWSQIKDYGADFGVLVTVRRSNKNQQAHVYIYGVEIEVTYTVPISNKLYFKQNGSWVEVSKAYKKVNGVWVEQSDLTTVFNSSTNYIKGN